MLLLKFFNSWIGLQYPTKDASRTKVEENRVKMEAYSLTIFYYKQGYKD